MTGRRALASVALRGAARGVWHLACLALLSAGCQSLGGASGPAASRDDIVAIRQFYVTEPWVRDEEGRVVGIMARVYFVPATKSDNEVPKGVFVRGTIKAALFTLNVRADGTYERQLAHEWSFTPQQAEVFRVLKPSLMGYSYALVLRWPQELDVMGREVQVMISYEREDGKTIAARGTRFRIPLPLGRPGGPVTPSAPASAPRTLDGAARKLETE